MIDFSDSRILDLTAGDLIYSEWPRSLDRAKINRIANGAPPYTREEMAESNITINCNDMTHPVLLHQGRAQYASILSQGQYFTAQTDHPKAPKHKRGIFSAIVETEANRPLKQSIQHYEAMRSGFASLVLHGISPAVWGNSEKVIQRPLGIEDVLIPSRTLIGFENLPFIYFRRSFTAMELMKATRGPNRDPGWNMPFVKRCMKWVDNEMTTGLDTAFQEVYKPESVTEDAKEDAGWYMGDRVPTVDCFDIYAYVEATKKQPAGWVRRIILDSWSNPGTTDSSNLSRREDRGNLDKPGKDHFLYTSGSRVVADGWQNIASFQYADLSAVSPFRYHSVRSLGWLTYAPCHLLMRMKCKFNEAVFEALMQYFRVASMDEAQRAMKLELSNLGFIDETLKPVTAAERYQPNAGLIEMGLQGLQGDIDSNSKSWTQNPNLTNQKTEKTKFQVMAEVQSTNALVSAGLQQSYAYKVFEYRENFRRMLIPNSSDPIARAFRVNCLRQGVPEEILVPEAWDIQAEKLMGQGNQTLELLTAEMLMQWRQMYDPESQRVILRKATFAATKDAGLALELVPEKPSQGSQAKAEASRVCSALMQNIPADMVEGTNPLEYIGEMLKILTLRIQAGLKSPAKMLPQKELQGLAAIAQNIEQHIKVIAADKTEAAFAKQAEDALSKLKNELKGFAQRLEAAMKKQQETQQKNGGGGNGEVAAKVLPAIIAAKTKAKIKEAESAQKLHHKNQQFHQQLKHDAIKTRAGIAKQDVETAANIRRGGMSSLEE